MRIRVLDLDGSITRQIALLTNRGAQIVSLSHWGPRIRMACRWGRFQQFERSLDRRLSPVAVEPTITFCGSGDFHHVSLALLRRLRGPCNLLVIDKHPDWMRGIPLLHCGTWLYHAARLPQVCNIFHVGGEMDFDNGYRWLAPTPLLDSGRLTVFPARRKFQGGFWNRVSHRPIQTIVGQVPSSLQLDMLLRPYRDVLASCPLYVSLDKDVLVESEAPVNWDSGQLRFDEVREILWAFRRAACDRLAGVDVVGDWSPVVTSGLLRALLHHTEHPSLAVDPEHATERHQTLNLELADLFAQRLPSNTSAIAAPAA